MITVRRPEAVHKTLFQPTILLFIICRCESERRILHTSLSTLSTSSTYHYNDVFLTKNSVEIPSISFYNFTTNLLIINRKECEIILHTSLSKQQSFPIYHHNDVFLTKNSIEILYVYSLYFSLINNN